MLGGTWPPAGTKYRKVRGRCNREGPRPSRPGAAGWAAGGRLLCKCRPSVFTLGTLLSGTAVTAPKLPIMDSGVGELGEGGGSGTLLGGKRPRR